MPLPLDFRCAECQRIAAELRAAFTIDAQEVRRRLLATAESSGRDARKMGTAWVFSVAEMPAQEMRTLLQAHYPTVTDARREQTEHEAATGHSVRLHGWRGNLR